MLPSWVYPEWCSTTPGLVSQLITNIANPASLSSGYIIPLYQYPSWWTTPGAWDWVITEAQANPGITFTVIINPSNGPGTTIVPNTDFQHEIARFAPISNIKMLGYVDTVYGTRSASDVAADVTLYAGWASYNAALAMDGIYFDKQAASVSYISQYTAYASQVKTNSYFLSGTVGFGPGSICDPSYFNIADFVIIFEEPSANIRTDLFGWYASFMTSLTSSQLAKTAWLIDSADSTTTVALSNLMAAFGSKYIYVTDQSGSTAYTSSPSTAVLSSILALLSNPATALGL